MFYYDFFSFNIHESLHFSLRIFWMQYFTDVQNDDDEGRI